MFCHISFASYLMPLGPILISSLPDLHGPGQKTYNPGEVGAGAGDGVCDFVDPGESILCFLVGTRSDRSLTSLS